MSDMIPFHELERLLDGLREGRREEVATNWLECWLRRLFRAPRTVYVPPDYFRYRVRQLRGVLRREDEELDADINWCLAQMEASRQRGIDELDASLKRCINWCEDELRELGKRGIGYIE